MRPRPSYQPNHYGSRRTDDMELEDAIAQYQETQRQQLLQKQLMMQEAMRRQNQKTFMEKVTDILNPFKWFG